MNPQFKWVTFLLSICMLMVTVAPLFAKNASLDETRKQFLAARNALNASQKSEYRRLSNKLQDYALYPYLQYGELRRNLRSAKAQDISRFLHDYADTPLADRLRIVWLKQLGRKKHWSQYLAFYQPSTSTKLQCYALRARRQVTPDVDVSDEIQALWLVGHSQHDSCDPLFDYLYASGKVTTDLRWERIRLAMKNGKLSLASYLAKHMPVTDQNWVNLWRQAHRRPARTLNHKELKSNQPIAREIQLHALWRMARSNPQEASKRWLRLRKQINFDPQRAAELDRSIALYAAYQRKQPAHQWLTQLPDVVRDKRVREWQARTALSNQDWPSVLEAIDAMPGDEQRDEQWRYWKGQALLHTNQRNNATVLLSELAQQRHYHGFLAADTLNWKYRMNSRPVQYTEPELDALLSSQQALVRARELYKLNLIQDAQREWYYVTQRLTSRELQLAAVLAKQWGWHDRAIMAASSSDHRDDLDLRFPILYHEAVNQASKRFKLDPAWIFGVVRQESAFMPNARSPAGALGLMQLMPATGKHTARLLRLPKPSGRTLLKAEANIQLGSGYLREVMNTFDNNPVLATAAYNAGPRQVRRWLPDKGNLPAAIWVDSIPYSETRQYVRGVMAFATVYEARLNRPVTRLEKRMHSIPASKSGKKTSS